MLSINAIKYRGNGMIVEAYGLSTDTKPTENILNGSSLIEMDTGKVYFYDEEGQEWVEFGGEGE